MEIVCLDLEGVLVPEIWIAFAEKTGIPEFKFAMPPMKKLGYPTLMCDKLEADANGKITGCKMRCTPSKLTTVKTLQSCGFTTIAAGDSFND